MALNATAAGTRRARPPPVAGRVLAITTSMPRPGKRYTASAVPSGAPIADAHTLAVRLTCKDKRMMVRNSALKLPISSRAIWKAEAKSFILSMGHHGRVQARPNKAGLSASLVSADFVGIVTNGVKHNNRGQHSVTIWRFFQLSGSACLVIVVLTHVAEAYHIFPAMGWGLPNSAGHHLDLASAILGCALVPLGFIGGALMRLKNSN